MPTKDRLEIVRYLLHKYLKEVNSVLWILPYVYELSIVLICKKAGLTTVNDKYDGWRLLLRTRNMYNAEDIKEILELLMTKRVLFNSFPVKKGEHI